MRILQIHKFFYPHAGSETVLFHTRDLLSNNGHEVIDFAMEHPKNVDSEYREYFAPRREYTDASRPAFLRARDALSSVYSLAARRQLRRLLAQVRPDVAHMHIIYHQLTMSVVDELAQARIPMVMTLHDYKIGCPAYVLYRDGRPCYDCTTGAVHNVVRHKCIKDSRGASMLAGAEAAYSLLGRKYQKIDAYVCPSAFAGRIAGMAGIPDERIHVVPNFIPDSELGSPVPSLDGSKRFFFAGRLEELKGVGDLLEAFREGDPAMGTLVIAGAGGEMEKAVSRAATDWSNVEYLGRLTRARVLDELRRSRAAVLPSRWNENNPMSIIEARMLGVPVIVSDRGGLPEMVADGVDGQVFHAGDVAGLRLAIRGLATDRSYAEALGRSGYERFCRDNTATNHYAALMGAYTAAVERGAPSS
ncbi:MAG TPA: glycosyltransferase [Solirubrobacteraceae bacterium]|jgi:glycosyltransferase involved in cell wall biosynthesis|nr:glycosyltransferase [Solirubrobacteraceae bacterium]